MLDFQVGRLLDALRDAEPVVAAMLGAPAAQDRRGEPDQEAARLIHIVVDGLRYRRLS